MRRIIGWSTLGLVGVAVVVFLTVPGEQVVGGLPASDLDGIAGLELGAVDGHALQRTLAVESSEPVRLEVDLQAQDHGLRVSTEEAASTHDLTLLGLRPDRAYDVSLRVLDEDGGELSSGEVGTVTTDPLPDDLPPIEVTVSDPQRMTPGWTLFNSIYRPGPEDDEDSRKGYLQAVDESGEVVWYHREQLPIQDARVLDDGNVLIGSDETGARLLTPTGEALAEWRGTGPGWDPETSEGDVEPMIVDVHSMHHVVRPLPDGSYLTLSRVLKEVEFPEPLCPDAEGEDEEGMPESGPTVEQVTGDSVVVFDPETGEVLAEHSLFDVLDPLDDPRMPEGDVCNAGYLSRHYGPEVPERDWTHANAVEPMDDGATFVVSARHTDQLVALRAVADEGGPAGSLRWLLGPDEDVDLRPGDADWFWHQHAPEEQPDGSILLYDNGNLRTDAPEEFSRAVRYEFDPDSGVAREVWEHRMDPDVYASFVGDADGLDGTVLITHGGLFADCPINDDTVLYGLLVEVEEATGETVFELRTQDTQDCTGYGIYRSERVAPLHEPGTTVEPLS